MPAPFVLPFCAVMRGVGGGGAVEVRTHFGRLGVPGKVRRRDGRRVSIPDAFCPLPTALEADKKDTLMCKSIRVPWSKKYRLIIFFRGPNCSAHDRFL